MLNTWIFHLSLYIDEPGAWPATQRKGSAVRCNECGASGVCGFFVSSFFAKVWSQTWMIFCGFLYPWGISNLEQIIQVFFLHVSVSHPGNLPSLWETLWTTDLFVWPKYLHWDPRRNCCISTVSKAMNQGLLIKFKQIKGKSCQSWKHSKNYRLKLIHANKIVVSNLQMC